MKLYQVKTLISGERIEGLDPKKLYIAVPDRGYKDIKGIRTLYNDDSMIIKTWHKALLYRRFHDQFRKGEFYTLGYFEWLPTEKYKKQEYEFIGGKAVPIN